MYIWPFAPTPPAGTMTTEPVAALVEYEPACFTPPTLTTPAMGCPYNMPFTWLRESSACLYAAEAPCFDPLPENGLYNYCSCAP